MTDEKLTAFFMAGVTIMVFISLIVVTFFTGCATKPCVTNAEPSLKYSSHLDEMNWETLCSRGIGCDDRQKEDLQERIKLREKGFMHLNVYPRPSQGKQGNHYICEMGFNCETIIDSTGVIYGRPINE